MTAERYFVCIDIGGTFIKHGLADRGGHIYKKGELPTEIKKKGVEGLLKKVAMIVASYRYEHKIAGVAISTPGVVDAALGEIIFAGVNFPGYTGTRLRAEIEARTGLPCAVQNDVKCVGLAESWIGAGSGAHSVFCMAVGTGIGGSLILAQEEYLRGRLEAALDRIMTNPLRNHVRLEFAKLKNDAGMLGALCHLLQTHPELNEVSK